jgi:type VI secretion system protein VasG
MSDLRGIVSKLNIKSKTVLEAAAHEAVSNLNNSVEIEHFLKSCIEIRDTDIEFIFKKLGVKSEVVLSELQNSIDKFPKLGSRTPSFSSQLVSVFNEAWSISSVEYGLQEIRTGILLYAILNDVGLKAALSISTKTLCEIDSKRVGAHLEEVFGKSSESISTKAPVVPFGDGSPNSFISKYTVDLTDQAKSDLLDPVIARDKEINEMIDILQRRRQNNPILLGLPGVGKTALVEGLARKIVAESVPSSLTGVKLFSLDLAQLSAGAGVKGEFEKRLKGLIKEIQDSNTSCLLFIDEAHSLIGAGGLEGKSDAANILKPALARGTLRVIAATTWSEYKKHIEKDAALVRRFQTVVVEEPTVEDTKKMLGAIVLNLEKHHLVRVDQSAIDTAVELSVRYISNRCLPDKAIALIDTACSRVALSQQPKPVLIQDLENDLLITTSETERLIVQNRLNEVDYSLIVIAQRKIKKIKNQITVLKNQAKNEQEFILSIKELERISLDRDLTVGELERLKISQDKLIALQTGAVVRRSKVDQSVVREIISTWTGIPVSNLSNKPEQKLLNLSSDLNENILGQTNACALISGRLQVAAAGLNDPNRPVGVFLLLGSSGVGKTETAKVVADIMFSGRGSMTTINMSEYQEAHSVAGLRGAPPGYIGFGEGGVLTEAVKRNPYNVVLLDEFEKAHKDVRELFYQVFDEGKLDDSDGVSVDFRNTIIFVTSNASSGLVYDFYKRKKFGSQEMMKELSVELADFFQPALLGRMTMVPFSPLSKTVLKKITIKEFQKISLRLENSFNVDVELDEVLVDVIVQHAESDYSAGARSIIQLIDIHVLPKISETVLGLFIEHPNMKKIFLSFSENVVTVKAE